MQAGEVCFDNSGFSQWDACNVKGLFGTVLRKQPTKGRVPLVFGGAVHAGLEYLMKGGSMEKACQLALENATKNNLDACADERRNASSLVSLLEGYAMDYRLRHKKFEVIYAGMEDPLVECSFKEELMTFDNCRPVKICWTGLFDALVYYGGDESGIWVLDHKTTSVMGPQFTADKERSSQFLGYVWAARRIAKSLGLPPIRGVLINAIALRSRGFDYQVFELPFNDWQIEEWEEDIKGRIRQKLGELLLVYAGNQVLPNREACVSKYGKCQFFDICQAHPRTREGLLNDTTRFETSTWSPLNER